MSELFLALFTHSEVYMDMPAVWRRAGIPLA